MVSRGFHLLRDGAGGTSGQVLDGSEQQSRSRDWAEGVSVASFFISFFFFVFEKEQIVYKYFYANLYICILEMFH